MKTFVTECSENNNSNSGYTLTTLQAVLTVLFIVVLIVLGVNAIVTYGSDSRPSEQLFKNSQTIELIR